MGRFESPSEPVADRVGPASTRLECLPYVLNADQVAVLLGLGRGSVYEALRRGDLPSVRIGRRILIPREPLLRLLGVSGDTPGAVAEGA